MKKKVKQLFNRVVAMIMALLTAVSVFPTSTVMAATEKATITFEYAYDSNGNTIHYQKKAHMMELHVDMQERHE